MHRLPRLLKISSLLASAATEATDLGEYALAGKIIDLMGLADKRIAIVANEVGLADPRNSLPTKEPGSADGANGERKDGSIIIDH